MSPAWLLVAVLLVILARYRYVLVYTRNQRAGLRVRVAELLAAIKGHRDQRSDDRCWMDDRTLYAQLGDGNLGDNQVGDKAAMLRNCARYIDRRCSGGGWRTYAQLEAQLEQLQTRRDATVMVLLCWPAPVARPAGEPADVEQVCTWCRTKCYSPGPAGLFDSMDAYACETCATAKGLLV